MLEFSATQEAVYFIDPPYTAGGKKAGKRLYKHYALDHEGLFTLCESLKGDFLMTYDHAEEVKEMARRHGFQMRLIPMTNTHHATMNELVIGRDLSWMDRFPAVHEPEAKYQVREKRRNVPVMVGGAVAHPAATTEPDVTVSGHPAPQSMGLCYSRGR
jgi:DNA adenine methylase